MKTVKDYIIEAADDSKEARLAEKQKKQFEKIEKLKSQLAKYTDKFNALVDKYKADTEMHRIAPVEVFNNFKYVSWGEIQKHPELYKGKYCEYNLALGEMYTEFNQQIYARHGYDNSKSVEANKAAYDAIMNDPDKDLTHRFYWDYMCKANDLIESIHKKERDLKDAEEKVITVSDKVKKETERKKRITDLFGQVPQLGKFIDAVAKEELKFELERNEKLKKAWERFDKETAKLDAKYGSSWSARCNRSKDPEAYQMYVDLEKTKPSKWYRTEAEIKRSVEQWKENERALLAERIYTEFGTVQSVDLYLGDDSNVNGIIIGSLKTARIETIWAGGYNIQCLHTRLLVHELK